MTSLFTKIVNRELPAYIIAEDEQFLAFLDINPLRLGHTLVIPKKEVDYIFDLEDELLKDMIVFAKGVSKKLKDNFTCKRIGMTVIGLEVPHAHIHLIPIDNLDDMNFAKPKLKVTEAEMTRIAGLF